MTITGIEKYKNMEGYVAVGGDLSGCSYIGIEEMTMKSQFFKAGTNIPVTIKSNMTLQDIDTHQYIGVKADDIHGEYVSKNTKLSYNKDGNKSIYYAVFLKIMTMRLYMCGNLHLLQIRLNIRLEELWMMDQQIRNNMLDMDRTW